MTGMQLRKTGWGLALGLLLLAAAGTALGMGFRWGPADFVVAALLIGAAGIGLEAAARLPGRAKWLGGAAMIGTALLIWAELAVGIFT